jgi:hypothetical protein
MTIGTGLIVRCFSINAHVKVVYIYGNRQLEFVSRIELNSEFKITGIYFIILISYAPNHKK